MRSVAGLTKYRNSSRRMQRSRRAAATQNRRTPSRHPPNQIGDSSSACHRCGSSTEGHGQEISMGWGGAVTAARILQVAKLAEGVPSVLDGLMNRHDAPVQRNQYQPATSISLASTRQIEASGSIENDRHCCSTAGQPPTAEMLATGRHSRLVPTNEPALAGEGGPDKRKGQQPG